MNGIAKGLLIFEIMFVVFSLVSNNVPIAQGEPRTIVVKRDAATIQEAIQLANMGDTVLVPAGVYSENIYIDKPIFLIGENRNTTIDGSGKPGNVVTIEDGVNHVTVKGFRVKGASEPFAGIRINGNFNEIYENNVTENFRGIYMYDSTANVLRTNQLAQNAINFGVWGLALSHFTHDIDVSNTVNGKPIYYWVNERNRTVPSDAGYVAAVNSFGISVKNLSLSTNEQGVLLSYTNHTRVENVTARNNGRGIQLVFSHENVISTNVVSDSRYNGIDLHSSGYNEIEGNRVVNNGGSGIIVAGPGIIDVPSDNNTVRGNLVSNNTSMGIQIERSTNTRICRNKVTRNRWEGIHLGTSDGSSIFENRVFENEFGFQVVDSARNSIYHNSIVNNTIQAYCSGTLTEKNTWDNGYPLGGNYWSDYEEKYPNATEIDGSGIWNTLYIIDAGNMDRYPLMRPKRLNTSPVAEFSTSTYDPVILHEVRFISESVDIDGDIIAFFWDFGDDSNSTEEHPIHIYEALGPYNVTLRVVDDEYLASTTYQTISLRKIRTFFTVTIPLDIEMQRPVELVSSLLDEYRNPIVGEHVLFYILKEDGEVLIGNVATNNTGVAKLLYSFALAGSIQLKVAFPGSPFYEASNKIEQTTVRSTLSAFPIIAFIVLIVIGFTLFRVFNKKRKKSHSNQSVTL